MFNKLKSGIYQIVHVKSGRRYIGQSKDVGHRLRKHKEKLIGSRHSNKALQNAWNKYSPAAFLFDPVMYCSLENLTMYEELCIKAFSSNIENCGYNFRVAADTNRGMRFESRKYKAGDKYNRLTLIERAENRGEEIRWKCKCDCGKTVTALVYAVISGNTKSCRCWNMESLRKMRDGIKIELFGESCSVLKASRILGIRRTSFYDRIRKLGETPQQACDHLSQKKALKIIGNCRSIIEQTMQRISA